MSDSNKRYWLGFDLGGTKMLATVYDDQFEKVGRKRKRTKGQEGVDFGVKRVKQTIRQALEESEVEASQLAGIGVGCPGPL